MQTNGFDRLIRLLDSEDHVSTTTGFTGVEVYHLPKLNSYLKIGPIGKISDLEREKDVLGWLAGRMGAPGVIDYEKTADREALLLTAVPGMRASDYLASASTAASETDAFITASARALREFHDLPIDDCPFNRRLPVRFEKALSNIKLGLLSETDDEFRAEHAGKSPLDHYHDLSLIAPDVEDLVFTHGDPSMPNILTDGDRINGFIDLDGAGIADRYVDIAIYFSSLYLNARTKTDAETAFCEGYGINGLDRAKLEFYDLIDDFF